MSDINHQACSSAMVPVRDALTVISGKWKLMILISITSGNNRFREIERSIPKMTPRVLSKELKALEENKLVKRVVRKETPISVEYSTTSYANTLANLITELRDWGINHRKELLEQ